jgi:hypothetical protein
MCCSMHMHPFSNAVPRLERPAGWWRSHGFPGAAVQALHNLLTVEMERARTETAGPSPSGTQSLFLDAPGPCG